MIRFPWTFSRSWQSLLFRWLEKKNSRERWSALVFSILRFLLGMVSPIISGHSKCIGFWLGILWKIWSSYQMENPSAAYVFCFYHMAVLDLFGRCSTRSWWSLPWGQRALQATWLCKWWDAPGGMIQKTWKCPAVCIDGWWNFLRGFMEFLRVFLGIYEIYLGIHGMKIGFHI